MELNSYFNGFIFFCNKNLASATANFSPNPMAKFFTSPLKALIGHVIGSCWQRFVIQD